MLVRGIAKPLARFAVAKFRLWPFCIGAAEPRFPALPGAGSLRLPQQQPVLTSPRVLTHSRCVRHDGAWPHVPYLASSLALDCAA